jgi:hypothetical protein
VSELLSDVLPASAEEAWVAYSAVRLYRVYGAGTFIAVLEDAVIDWDADSDALRSRIAARFATFLADWVKYNGERS